jgi:acyl carrier protein
MRTLNMKEHSRTAQDLLMDLKESERIRRQALELCSDSTEGKIAHMWRDILGVREVAPTDNIFSLGGDSLHMVQITAMISDLFDVEITFGEFFDAPTVRELALVVDNELLGRRN